MKLNQTKLTKIVATLGPASEDPEIIRDLIVQGVNVFRFNTKHGTPEWHQERIKRVQQVADSLKVRIGILLDLQGPELRLETKNQQTFSYQKGDQLTFATHFAKNIDFIIPHQVVFQSLQPGDLVLIDDGYVEGRVIKVNQDSFVLEMLNSGEIKHRKGVNLPGKFIDLPSLIDNDLKQLDMASLNKVDFIALSFVRTPKDIDILRQEMKQRNLQAKVVAKIENQTALDNLEAIIQASDAVMVARGDLGIEIPIERIAYWQKKIIKLSRQANKPVITATQMLESMIHNPLPTRAEATDVANAVLDGSDALMLSAETAAGAYPVQAVSFMSRIAKFNEHKLQSIPFDGQHQPDNLTQQIAYAAFSLITHSLDKKIDAVVVFTETGYTARVFASYHLNLPVIAVTDSPQVAESLTLSYGIYPYVAHFSPKEIVTPESVTTLLARDHILSQGDQVLVIHGKHWRTPGLTNSLSILEIS